MYARMNTNGDTNINLDELKTELNKNFNNDVSINKKGEDGALPWRVTNNGYMFEITETGEVKKVNGIALDKSNIKLLQGESETITAELTQGVTGTITWTSNNDNVKVAETGNDKTAQIEVEEDATGTATITATIEGTEYSATCEVKVVLAITSLSLADAKVESGNTVQLEITKIPSEGETENIIFKSSNEKVATVDNNGLVTAQKGITEDTEVTITATPEKTTGKEAKCKVTILKIERIVSNYNVKGLEWKVFYVDEEDESPNKGDIYLIPSDYVPVEKLPLLEWMGKSTDSTGTPYNVWWSQVPSSIQKASSGGCLSYENTLKLFKGTGYTLSDNYINSRCVSTLLNTDNWTSFVDSSWADYAIGGPTIEMFVASWNKSYPSDKIYCNNTCSEGYYVGTTSDQGGMYANVSDKNGYKDKLFFPYTSKYQNCKRLLVFITRYKW